MQIKENYYGHIKLTHLTGNCLFVVKGLHTKREHVGVFVDATKLTVNQMFFAYCMIAINKTI